MGRNEEARDCGRLFFCIDEGDERRLFGGKEAPADSGATEGGTGAVRPGVARAAGSVRSLRNVPDLARGSRAGSVGMPALDLGGEVSSDLPHMPAEPVERLLRARAAGRRGRRRGRTRIGWGRAARVLAPALAVVLAAAVVVLAWRYGPEVWAWVGSPAAVRALVEARPVLARLAIVGVNVAQIVVAVIPGEPVELASGYALGFWEGTLSCLVASAVGSTLVFFAVRRWGKRVVGLFFSPERLDEVAWLKDTARLELVMFLVFLIPGTPKDLLTYAAGLTRMRYRALLPIVTVGRIPSVVTSTFAAAALGAGKWEMTLVALGIGVALALAGGAVYALIQCRMR